MGPRDRSPWAASWNEVSFAKAMCASTMTVPFDESPGAASTKALPAPGRGRPSTAPPSPRTSPRPSNQHFRLLPVDFDVGGVRYRLVEENDASAPSVTGNASSTTTARPRQTQPRRSALPHRQHRRRLILLCCPASARRQDARWTNEPSPGGDLAQEVRLDVLAAMRPLGMAASRPVPERMTPIRSWGTAPRCCSRRSGSCSRYCCQRQRLPPARTPPSCCSSWPCPPWRGSLSWWCW